MLEVEKFEEMGSSWVVKSILFVDIYTANYEPLRAAVYQELPPYLIAKKAIVNPQNQDECCFMWSLLAALYPKPRNPGRISQYEEHVAQGVLNFENISFPVKIADIAKFTQLNNISVNVFSYDEEKKIFPVYLAKLRLDVHVNLMKYDNHYSYIRNFDRLLGDQNRHRSRGYYCDMCMHPMYCQERLDAHRLLCSNSSLAALEMPKTDVNILKFNNFHKTLRKPVVVYADFEAILEPISTCLPKADASFTAKYQKHEACSVGMVVSRSCCYHPEFTDMFLETGEAPVDSFLKRLMQLANNHAAQLDKYPPLNLTPAEEQSFRNARTCGVCKDILGCDRVRDHCHICGRYRGALHSSCNQKLRLDRDVVVVMHNLRRYDAHFIMRTLGKACHENDLSLTCVAKGMEDYVTFSTKHGNVLSSGWCIRFIDSFQFLPASLEKLVEQLSFDEFKCMRRYLNDDEVRLMSRKGVFPYDFLDSFEKLHTQNPIAREHFYNKLNKTNITDADFNHYMTVCRDCLKTLQDYLEVYLKGDVAQPADIFETFRAFSLQNFGLDPCHYSTLPGLSWDSYLKTTGVELELLTDIYMYTFFEKGIRGGISVISQRFAVANNKYMCTYNEEDAQSYIAYYDANSLYGWSMNEKLPTKGFRWLAPEEVANFRVDSIDCNGDMGYILETDLTYPEALHDRHNCYPLAPEKLTITSAMLSPYCQRIADELHVKVKPVLKLAPNLYDKTNYIVDIRNLKYNLHEGLLLKKIHRILEFKQEAWMSPFIQFNTQKRREATTEFGKTMPKFFINASFGKTMENVRLYINIELVTSKERLRKLVKKPQFKRATIFSEGLVGVCMLRTKILLNKSIYIGFVVLDLSKLLMFTFHYGYMKPTYGDKVHVCMTDTDSLLYHIETDGDVYQDMLKRIDLFDTSDYPNDHFLKSNVNKKGIGKMKDELAGAPALSFVGLRSKMYSLETETEEKKRAKGIKRNVVQKQMRHNDYYTSLVNSQLFHHQMETIRSQDHHLYSTTLCKKSLTCYDDKRYILADGIHSLAYGHRLIPK